MACVQHLLLQPAFEFLQIGDRALARKTEGPRAYARYMGSSATSQGWMANFPAFKASNLLTYETIIPQMKWFVAHFDVLKKYMITLKMGFPVNQSNNKT